MMRAALRPDTAPMQEAGGYAVTRLRVTAFRNYRAAGLDIEAPAVVLVGPNGAGKTNLLEAISLLAPGRGLRRARLADLDRIVPAGAGASPALGEGWAVAATVRTAAGERSIGTGRDPRAEAGRERRLVRIDRAPARGQSALAEMLAVSWLTPRMDRLFIDGAAQRRRFLDRLVYAFDGAHGRRVNACEQALRERSRLLREGCADPAWLGALEQTIAETGVAVTAARCQLIDRLNAAGAGDQDDFPGVALRLADPVSDWLRDGPALAAEDRLRTALAAGRRQREGETWSAPGPHRADLEAWHQGKGLPAGQCSTGEQKAMAIAIILAHARLRRRDRGAAPLLLLDEVAAHLDQTRRQALFEQACGLGSQIWLTGTDAHLFSSLRARAQFHAVQDGTVAAAHRPQPTIAALPVAARADHDSD